MKRLGMHQLDPEGVADGNYVVTVAGGVIGITTPAVGTTARWEVVLAGTPPEPVTNADGTDWLYVEV